MRRVSVREFNSTVTKTLDAVEQGDTVVITRGGKPVARLVREPAIDVASDDWAMACREMMDRMEQGAPLGGARADYDERTG